MLNSVSILIQVCERASRVSQLPTIIHYNYSILVIQYKAFLPHHPQLPILLFHDPPHPLLHNLSHNPPPPVKAISTDRENAVVCFQHIIACPDHNGFCQIFRDEAVYLVADFEYFLFVHRHSPFQFLHKKYQPSYLTVGKVQFTLFFSTLYTFYNFYLLFIINKSSFFKFCQHFVLNFNIFYFFCLHHKI